MSSNMLNLIQLHAIDTQKRKRDERGYKEEDDKNEVKTKRKGV